MRLTMVVDGSKTAVEQVIKQLYKVIEVRKVSDLTDDQTVERELALIKVTSQVGSAARGDHPDRGHLPGARRRHRDELADRRGDRAGRQGRLHGLDAAAVRHQGDGPHRPGGDGARRMSGQEKGREALRLREVS